MAVVRPFKALRYNFEKAGAPETVCCPPYDIIPDPSVWTGRNPSNAILLEGGERLGTPEPYDGAKKLLDKWLGDGTLRVDDKPGFYVYEVTFTAQDGSRRALGGIFAHVELRPFSDGVVLPHEKTLSAAKADRYELMTATGCHFSPIYALYEDSDRGIAHRVAKARRRDPVDSFTMPDGTDIKLWIITDDEDCGGMSDSFASKKLYIADGHHRYETSLKVRQEVEGASPYVMMFLADVDDPGLEVQATHRVVSRLASYDEAAVRERLERDFTLTPKDEADFGKPCWITASGSWLLTPKERFDGLDVLLLQDGILEPVFGIDRANLAAQTNVSYTRDSAEALELVRSGKAQCAFLLAPTLVRQICETADSGSQMPQKSTYFYPKIITGLVMNRFKEM